MKTFAACCHSNSLPTLNCFNTIIMFYALFCSCLHLACHFDHSCIMCYYPTATHFEKHVYTYKLYKQWLVKGMKEYCTCSTKNKYCGMHAFAIK